LVMIPLDRIRISSQNIRVDEPFGDEEDLELIESIKAQGVIQPIIVRQIGDIYEVDIGRRRFLGAKEAGLEEIQCIVREMTLEEAMDSSISENIFRKDVDPVTLGWWVKGRLERSGMSLRELARELGTTAMTLSRWRTMTNLTEEMQQEVRRKAVSLRNALEVAKMDLTPDEERALAEESRSGGSDSFKKALYLTMTEKETRGAPKDLLITRINWGLVSPEYEALNRRADEAGIEHGEYCQRVLTDHIKEI